MSETVTPSKFQEPCVVCAPLATKIDCWPLWLPPTFNRSIWTPGIVCMTTQGSRALGIMSISLRVTVAPVPTFLVSSNGASPVTVTEASTFVSLIVTRMSVL